MLELLAREFRASHGLELEFSLRLSCGILQNRGRFACWINGTREEDFSPVANVLGCIEAPSVVIEAQRNHPFPVRQAVAVSMDHVGPEFRLYLHGRDAHTLNDRCHAWRWRSGNAPRRSEYVFYFFPESASGIRPLDLIPDELRSVFQRLLEEPLLLEMSGFWLRQDPQGEVDQLDIAFPWHPCAGQIPGISALVRAAGIPEAEFDVCRTLPIRHLALSLGGKSPSVTLYASATLTGLFPTTEQELQTRIWENSVATQRAIEQEILQALPPSTAQEDDAKLWTFYDGPIGAWQAILGDELHYHAGLFDSANTNPNDAAMNHALRRAVTELYPFLPAGGRLYDVGCGWGGPLEMFIRDLRCRSLGVTISHRQFQYIASRGLPVRWGDAEKTLPPGQFDCIVLLESLSHIRDKQRLLQVLRLFTKRLVMRVNCQDSLPPGTTFAGSMHMVSSNILRTMLETTGWKIIHWRNRRPEALPSVSVWRRRLQFLAPTNDLHLETFRAWCNRVMSFPEDWASNNPLIEVVAVT